MCVACYSRQYRGRNPRPPKIRECVHCGQMREHEAKGYCNVCYGKHGRPPRQEPTGRKLVRKPADWACGKCGEVRPHKALDMCRPCYGKHTRAQEKADRPTVERAPRQRPERKPATPRPPTEPRVRKPKATVLPAGWNKPLEKRHHTTTHVVIRDVAYRPPITDAEKRLEAQQLAQTGRALVRYAQQARLSSTEYNDLAAMLGVG